MREEWIVLAFSSLTGQRYVVAFIWIGVRCIRGVMMRDKIRLIIGQAISSLQDNNTLSSEPHEVGVVVERPGDRRHGGYASNAAMVLAKSAGLAPRVLARALIEVMKVGEEISRVDIAGPGFLNFHLSPEYWREQVRSVHKLAGAYGWNRSGSGRSVVVEYVSANPTGPLHVGHGRAGVIGDCIARALVANGWQVKREYYYNDAGVQIDNLARSVQARIHGSKPGDIDWPAEAYNGDYIADIAREYMHAASTDARSLVGIGDANSLSAIRQFSVARLRAEQDADLAAFGVVFDDYFLESSLYEDNKVDETVSLLVASGHTYEEGGALWLRSTTFGDDKDRVIRKSDGSYTYFVPDVAYHLNKWQRGYGRAVTELGADHHGSLSRVKAGLQALQLGVPADFPEYMLHQMVSVVRGGEEVKLSKRVGSYLTLRDLIDEVGADAVRWFLVSRNADSQLTFDIDLARSRSLDNPVYYVQLVHARICGLERQVHERGMTLDLDNGTAHFGQPEAVSLYGLVSEVSRFPEVVAQVGERLQPHLIPAYLLELGQAFQAYYNDHQFLVENSGIRDARLAVAIAVRQVMANGLQLLGIGAPERM